MPLLLRRVGLIGDPHAEDGRLEIALDWLQSQNCDQILCTGDVVDGWGDAARCVALLSEAAVLTVRGNHDRWFLQNFGRDLPDSTPSIALNEAQRRCLAQVPAALEFATPLGPLLLCHGVDENDMQNLRPDDYGYALEANLPLQNLLAAEVYRMMIGGHTHQRMVKNFGNLLVLNAGTLRREHEPCCALLDLVARDVQFWNVAPDGMEPAQKETF